MSYHAHSSNQKSSKRAVSPNDKGHVTHPKVFKACSDTNGGIATSSQQQDNMYACVVNIAEYQEKILSEAQLLKLSEAEVSVYVRETKQRIATLTAELKKLSEQRDILQGDASKIEETLKDARKIQEERNARQVGKFIESYHGNPQTAQRMLLLAVKIGLEALKVNISDGVPTFIQDVDLLKKNMRYQPPNPSPRDHCSYSKEASGFGRGAR